jgi:hypothetical protein
MKTLIWTVVGLGVGAGIVLGATGITEGTQPTYIIPTTQPATTPVTPVTVSVTPTSPAWTPNENEREWPPTHEDPTGPPEGADPTEVPCVPVNQDAAGNCGIYGVNPYPPGDPRLGVPANPSPTPVPEAPFAPSDFGPHLV